MSIKILVTGTAGFIGYHLVKKLVTLDQDFIIYGIDNINDYYDIKLKLDRLLDCGIEEIKENIMIQSKKYNNYYFIKADIEDKNSLTDLFSKYQIDYVYHLAARAGVRSSIDNPELYANTNIIGFINIIECCRQFQT